MSSKARDSFSCHKGLGCVTRGTGFCGIIRVKVLTKIWGSVFGAGLDVLYERMV